MILAGGAAAAVAAMVLSPANAVFVMGAVAVVHAPYAAFKEMRIIKLPGESLLAHGQTAATKDRGRPRRPALWPRPVCDLVS